MAKSFPDVRRLKCWAELEKAGFVSESYRDENGKVNCIGAGHPVNPGLLAFDVVVNRNVESELPGAWFVSVALPESEPAESVLPGSGIVPFIRAHRPDLFPERLYTLADLKSAFAAGVNCHCSIWQFQDDVRGKKQATFKNNVYHERYFHWWITGEVDG